MNKEEIIENLNSITLNSQGNIKIRSKKKSKLKSPKEECEHEYSDGTGTGYYICKHCGDMY